MEQAKCRNLQWIQYLFFALFFGLALSKQVTHGPILMGPARTTVQAPSGHKLNYHLPNLDSWIFFPYSTRCFELSTLRLPTCKYKFYASKGSISAALLQVVTRPSTCVIPGSGSPLTRAQRSGDSSWSGCSGWSGWSGWSGRLAFQTPIFQWKTRWWWWWWWWWWCFWMLLDVFGHCAGVTMWFGKFWCLIVNHERSCDFWKSPLPSQPPRVRIATGCRPLHLSARLPCRNQAFRSRNVWFVTSFRCPRV